MESCHPTLLGRESNEMSLEDIQTQIQYIISECSISYSSLARVVNDLGVLMYDTRLFSIYPVTYEYSPTRKVRMLQAAGLLPIYFRNVKYNTPMRIHIPLNYPDEAPIMYVSTPDKNMHIVKVTSVVDRSSGRVDFEYLSRWTRFSSLAESLSLLASEFGARPPLYSDPNTPSSVLDQHFTYYCAPAYAVNTDRLPSVGELSSDLGELHLSDSQMRLGLEQMVEAKLGSALQRRHTELSEEVRDLFRRKSQVIAKTETLRSVTSARTAQQQQATAKLSIAEAEVARLRALVEGGRERAEDPVSCLTYTHPLAQQLAAAVTKDQAADDTLTQLDAVLVGGRVSADAYVKEVKNVARQQYMDRALAAKIALAMTTQ